MNIQARFLLILMLILICTVPDSMGQENIFSLFKTDMKRGDQYYEEGNFRGALNLYKNAEKKNSSTGTLLKIARCYYFLKRYEEAIVAYDELIKRGPGLSLENIYYYAEAQSAVSNYVIAIQYYKQLLAHTPNDEQITRKIWRLNNIMFLYEDSLYYSVRPIPINTEYGELCATPFRDGLIFMSNRKEVQLVENTDAALNAPFYRLYYSRNLSDSTHQYSRPVVLADFNSKFHTGPVRFYGNERKMIVATSGESVGENGKRNLQLYFGVLEGNSWRIIAPFPHNDVNYSFTDPSISSDGLVLFFSSDKKGGFGGKDLYKSEFIDGQWTQPINLGEQINTVKDEVFPYLYQKRTLYFSSDGHAGMGGLDIFKAEIGPGGFGEPQNAGYPLNTNYDEFGVSIDSLGRHGYLTSNRKKGGYDDDLYEFDTDLQTFPLELKAMLRYKEYSWSDESSLKAMPMAKVFLVDNVRNITVYETKSDSGGNFQIVLPYFSKYKIKVIADGNEEHFVILEIPRQAQVHAIHEIVIVKDRFRLPPIQVEK